MSRPTTHVSPARFFGLTFLLSWAVWLPLDLAHFRLGGVSIAENTSAAVRLLGVLMPATAAIILTALDGGREGLGNLLKRLGIWRVRWVWWAAAVAVQPGLAVGIAWSIGLTDPSHPILPVPPQSAPSLAINILFLGIATLGEEIGWRGIALPSLQQRKSALRASAILGTLWAIWHIPFWLLLDTFSTFGPPYLVMNALFILPVTFYITWFFNHTRQSLLLPVAFHVTFNIVNVTWLPVTLDLKAFWILIALEWLIALALLGRLQPARTSALT